MLAFLQRAVAAVLVLSHLLTEIDQDLRDEQPPRHQKKDAAKRSRAYERDDTDKYEVGDIVRRNARRSAVLQRLAAIEDNTVVDVAASAVVVATHTLDAQSGFIAW